MSVDEWIERFRLQVDALSNRASPTDRGKWLSRVPAGAMGLVWSMVGLRELCRSAVLASPGLYLAVRTISAPIRSLFIPAQPAAHVAAHRLCLHRVTEVSCRSQDLVMVLPHIPPLTKLNVHRERLGHRINFDATRKAIARHASTLEELTADDDQFLPRVPFPRLQYVRCVVLHDSMIMWLLTYVPMNSLTYLGVDADESPKIAPLLRACRSANRLEMYIGTHAEFKCPDALTHLVDLRHLHVEGWVCSEWVNEWVKVMRKLEHLTVQAHEFMDCSRATSTLRSCRLWPDAYTMDTKTLVEWVRDHPLCDPRQVVRTVTVSLRGQGSRYDARVFAIGGVRRVRETRGVECKDMEPIWGTKEPFLQVSVVRPLPLPSPSLRNTFVTDLTLHTDFHGMTPASIEALAVAFPNLRSLSLTMFCAFEINPETLRVLMKLRSVSVQSASAALRRVTWQAIVDAFIASPTCQIAMINTGDVSELSELASWNPFVTVGEGSVTLSKFELM